ncbi:hypothetical protein LCGC14_0514580 [marine sediment metagenome]|uniref:Uncharacterized protein n=1 Tax=marine sediment metagenome TaxID=412755 RepID=A0A0F9S521_9ZZZZ
MWNNKFNSGLEETRVMLRFDGHIGKRIWRLMMLIIKGWCYVD